MVNRNLLRIKVIQMLYAHYIGGQSDLYASKTELNLSIKKSYDLYHYFLRLVVDVTRLAELRIDNARNKIRPTATDLNPSVRFLENRLAAQLRENKMLNKYVEANAISWADNADIVRMVLDKIYASGFYVDYMNKESVDYEADKSLWIKIFRKIILSEDVVEQISDVVEEQCIYLVHDVEIVASFAMKTLKMFDEKSDETHELLPMFQNDVDREFVSILFDTVICNDKKYTDIINDYTQNWDVERIAAIDMIILKTALSELFSFPTIPVTVTFNEYIDLAKMYSTPRSGIFVNGVLDKIVSDLKKENKLQKVGFVSDKSK
jgi:N utilization substance protein B